jgi:hypothetical protein
MTRYYAGILAVGLSLLLMLPTAVAQTRDEGKDKEKKKINITLLSDIKQGEAPLPGHFVAEIIADKELDQYLYESSVEWLIEGSFVLTDTYTGGDPMPIEMRGSSPSASEYHLRSQRHMVTKSRVKAPRKKYDPEFEVKRVYEFDYTFDRPGEYFVRFRLRNGMYSSPEVRITVKGDTSYDPIRDPY